jgi:octaprenyl-diphosphate synthase
MCPPTDRERLAGIVKNHNRTDEDLKQVMRLVQDLAGIEYTVKRAAGYVDQAQAALSAFPASPEKEALLAVSDYTLKRKK